MNGGSASMLYRAPVADFMGSAGVGTGYSQSSVGMRGAVVAHPGGLTLSQPLSETFGIVEAPDAEGARLLNASGVRVNSRGYAVVPHLTPYRMNAVDIDPKGLSTDVELQVTSQQVAPRAGAVAMLRYATVSGRSAMLQVLRADGKPLPFGASVQDEHGVEVGLVGQASRILARGLQDMGQLTVKWGEQPDDSCRMNYELPVMEKDTRSDGYWQVETRCN
jgi:outer membrane usher protein